MRMSHRFKARLASMLAFLLLLMPALAGAGAKTTYKPGDTIVTETLVDGEQVGTITYEAANLAAEGADEVVLLLPASAQGAFSEDFTPITPTDVAAFLNWYQVDPEFWCKDLERNALPVRWYMELVQACDDPQEGQALIELLYSLSQTTGKQEAQAYYNFLSLASLTPQQFLAALADRDLTFAELTGQMAEVQCGFEDLLDTYETTPQSVEDLVDFKQDAALGKGAGLAFLKELISSIIMEVAMKMITIAIESAIPAPTGVKVKPYKGRVLESGKDNPMLYTGGTMGASNVVEWHVPKKGAGWTSLGTRVKLQVRDVYGATRSDNATLGQIFYPYIGMDIVQAEADNGWVLTGGDLSLTTLTGKSSDGKYYVKTETVGGKVVPILFAQVTFVSQHGSQVMDQTYTFKLRGDQAPFLMQ